MKRDRKDGLQSPDAIERMRQDAEALILASKRLAEEMRALAERAQQVAIQQVKMLDSMKRAKDK